MSVVWRCCQCGSQQLVGPAFYAETPNGSTLACCSEWCALQLTTPDRLIRNCATRDEA